MRHLRALFLRFLGVFSGAQKERELSEEINCHIELQAEDNRGLGMTAVEAKRQAILKLGGVETTKQAYRERQTLPLLEALHLDLRFALRQLRRNPGFTFTSIFVLALGICASVAIFAFVDAALIKPLPYSEPNRLVGVMGKTDLFPLNNLSYPDYLDWKRANNIFESFSAWTQTGYLLKMQGGTTEVPATRVSADFFRTLRVVPSIGRDFLAGEDSVGKAQVAILSYSAWKDKFGGQPNLIGRPILLNGLPYTVVGVLPRDFQFAPRGKSDLWTLLKQDRGCEKSRDCRNLNGIGRLKEGITVRSADAAMKRIAADLERQYPESNRGQGAVVLPLSEIVIGSIRPILLMLLGGVALLMIIACANVAGLLLARSDSRRLEIALRGALGAPSIRLFCQFATEGLILAVCAGVLGSLAATGGMRLLLKLIPTDLLLQMPYLQGLGMTTHVLTFALLLALSSSVLFALTPTLRVSFNSLQSGLADGGRGSGTTSWRRFGSTLVVVELAVAVVLLVGAALLVKSVDHLLNVPLGFNPDHLATFSVAALGDSYSKDAQQVALAQKLLTRISSLPGVQSAGVGSMLPVSFNGHTDWVRFVGRPYNGKHNEVNGRTASTGYFKALGAQMVRGRSFRQDDDLAHPLVAIVNQRFVDEYFPGQNPIGQRFGDTELTPKSIKEIVGVVDDVHEGSLEDPVWPAVYYPFNQSPDKTFAVVVRVLHGEEILLPELDAIVHREDPDVGTLDQMTMSQKISNSQSAYLHRSMAWLVSAFASVALLLSIVGLYGVISYSVSQRTREIGVRIALGAQRAAVYELVLKESVRLCAAGIAIGLATAVLLAGVASSLLIGVRSWDPASLGSVTLILCLLGMGASYLPARRAASIDPVEALRAN